jgi:hypothetical protein
MRMRHMRGRERQLGDSAGAERQRGDGSDHGFKLVDVNGREDGTSEDDRTR